MADEFDRAVLLAAYRMAQVPGTPRRERVLARLRAPDDRPVFLPMPRPAPRRGLPLRIVLLAAAAGLLAVLGLELLGGGLAVRFDRAPPDQAVDAPGKADEVESVIEREEHVAAPRRRDAPVATSAVVPPPPVVAAPIASPPAVVPAKPASAPKRRDEAAVAEESVAAAEPERAPTEHEQEAAMIADALAALDRRAWGSALQALAKHAKQFPKGEFALERDALRIVVRCQREHSEAARVQARDFIVRTALSPHWQRIIDACRATAPPVVDPFHENRDKTAER